MTPIPIHVVIDRDNKDRILGIFLNESHAKEFAYDNNGIIFQRFAHHEPPEKAGYIK